MFFRKKGLATKEHHFPSSCPRSTSLRMCQPLLNLATVNRGNGYETWQSSLLYVFVGYFGVDPAQNLTKYKKKKVYVCDHTTNQSKCMQSTSIKQKMCRVKDFPT